MAYAHTNSKGATYYLHSKGKMFFFSKEVKEGALDAVPEGYHVAEMKTGLLVLKKNAPAEAAPAEMPTEITSETPSEMTSGSEMPSSENMG